MDAAGADGSDRIRPEDPGDARNVLLLVPSMHRADVDACIDLLTVADPRDEHVLAVTFTRSPEERLGEWRARVDVDPAAFTIVGVGTSDGSTASGSADPRVDVVSDPADLTGLGVRITERLGDADADVTVLCFHSITTLLQYAELRRVYRFLHVLTGHVRDRDALAHYHMSPDAHEPRSVNTLKTLFDAVIEFDGEGGWTARGR